MIIVYGTRFYGKVKACGSSFLATQFVHLWYLPLIPIGTKLVLQESSDGSFQGIKAPFSFKSMLAGYLRVWGPIAVLATIAMSVSTLGDTDGDALALVVVGAFMGVVVLVLLVATVLAYAWMGKLSDDEKRKRSVYSLHTGYFVDPGDMGDARPSVRDALLSTVTQRVHGLASMGYRLNADPTQAWPHVALDPTHSDDALVTAAFTLARLEASAAQGPQKFQMEQLHDQLWQRIARTNPPYLEAHAQVR